MESVVVTIPGPSGALLAVVVHELDVVAVRIEDVGAEVAFVIDAPLARWAVVAVPSLNQRLVEVRDRRVSVGGKRHVQGLGRRAGEEREGATLPDEPGAFGSVVLEAETRMRRNRLVDRKST